MKIRVTEEDLRTQYITALNNPISIALRRVTGKLWYVFDGTSTYCTTALQRPVNLPRKVAMWWQDYKNSTSPSPIEFELDIK
ncbi:MAG TPA: hypothetical protein VF600_18445 [Abditibacteriaceae bacterium]